MKSRILIYWHPRSIIEIIFPIINDLKFFFDIYLIVDNDTIGQNHIEEFIKLKQNKSIKDFFYSPKNNNSFLTYKYYRDLSKKLQKLHFNYFISTSNVHTVEKIICDKILTKNSKIILLWPTITYLFMRHQSLVKKILINNLNEKNLIEYKNKKNFFSIIKLILFSIRSFRNIFKKYFLKIKLKIIFPLIVFKKIYINNKKEMITQITDKNFNHIIFFDKLEVEVHKFFFNSNNIHYLNHSNNLTCNCDKNLNIKDNLLIPLSGYEKQKKIPQKYIDYYLRDIKTIIDKLNIKEVHLRPHPDFINFGWSNQLNSFLIKNGILSKIVSNSRPIREIICNYKCVAGFATNVFREASMFCNKIIIIGFESVSKSYFDDPKFVFGSTDKIGWINENGSYNENIFDLNIKTLKKDQNDVSNFLLNLSRKDKQK